MSDLYKPVNDKTLADVQKANDAAWDSGEFRHTDAEEIPALSWMHNKTGPKEIPHKTALQPKDTKQVHLPRTNKRTWRKGVWS